MKTQVLKRRALTMPWIAVCVFALSGSALAQSRLPFVGTQTFCGQISVIGDLGQELKKVETKTFVTIRNDGFTTVRTNMSNGVYRTGKPTYYTVSGKLSPKWEMTKVGWYLKFTSGTSIKIEGEDIGGEAQLCSNEVVSKKNDPAATQSPRNPMSQRLPVQQTTPDALVAGLYRQEEKVFQAQSRVLLDKYFDKSLADLIWKQLLNWEQIEDFDYVLHNFGYGGDITSVSKPIISKPTYEGQKARVSVSEVVVCAPPSCAKKSVNKYTMIFLLAAGETGWKITDIKYDCGFDWCIRGEKVSLSEIYTRDSKSMDELASTKNDSAAANSIVTQVKLTQEDVTRLRAYVDPNTGESCNFPDDPKILPQLRLLLGEDLPHLEDNLGRGSGCWIKNGWLGFDGFRPHNGGQEHGFVSIKLDNGGLVAGLFTNKRFKVYGFSQAYNGNLRSLPGPLTDWIQATWAVSNSLNAPPNIELQRFQPLKTAVANPTPNASSQTYVEVPLKEVNDLSGLGRSFPFLKSELDELIADNKKPASGFGPTNVYVFDLNQKGLPRLIFVAMDGGRVCGSAGCSLTIYRAQGKGFARVLDALVDVQSPIYISTDRSSLLTCGSGGRGDWRFRNNEFEPVPGKPRPSQKLAPCGTHAISDAGNANTTVTATPRLPVERPTSEKPTSEVAKETDPAALELSYWESIRNSRNPEDFKAYLEKYPNGQFAEVARLRVQQFSRPVSNTPSNDAVAAERTRNTRVFEVRDAGKKSRWLTVASDSISFEPKKSKEGKSITIQCSEIKHIEQGQSTVASPHINLFLNGTERAVVFYTSSGGTGLVGIFVNSKPVRPVVDITAKVINAISEACKLNPNNP